MSTWNGFQLDPDDFADPREFSLEQLRVDAGWCANCCIAEGCEREHDDCAGPEGYACDCPCDGAAVPPETP